MNEAACGEVEAFERALREMALAILKRRQSENANPKCPKCHRAHPTSDRLSPLKWSPPLKGT